MGITAVMGEGALPNWPAEAQASVDATTIPTAKLPPLTSSPVTRGPPESPGLLQNFIIERLSIVLPKYVSRLPF